MSVLFYLPKAVAVQSSGIPYASARAYFYETGTTTQKDVFTDSGLSVAFSQPVEADAAGVFPPIYLDPTLTYKLTLKTLADVLVYTIDPILDGTLTQAQLGSILYPRTAAEIAAGVTPTNYSYPAYWVDRYGTNTAPGTTDMTAAIQAAFAACPAYAAINFCPSGIYLISSVVTGSTDNVTVFGNGAKIKASITPFSRMMTLDNRTGLTLRDLEFDINGPARTSGQSTTLNAVSFGATTDCSAINVTVRNALGFGATSATSMAASGNSIRFKAINCRFLNNGTSATSAASDGLFVRGDGCQIVDCHADSCTDTAFVLEGCNHSLIANCTSVNCTSVAAISNDTASDCVGNIINGLTGSNSYVGSTGGVLGVTCFNTGNILQSKVSNVSIRTLAGAGFGPVIQIRTTSTGRVSGLEINDLSVDIGSASAVIAQAMLISDSDSVTVSNPSILMDLTAGTDCIKFSGGCVRGIVNGGRLTKATRGVNVADTSAVLIQGVTMFDQDDYGINAADTSVVTSRGNNIIGASLIAQELKASGATLVSDIFQNWTPTYSSDVGNAATTFNGAVTTNVARYSVSGNSCTVVVYYAATLKAVTPNYIELTLPSGVTPLSNNERNPADVLNNATRETGVARTITTPTIRVYRANSSNYTASVAVEGAFTFTFEIV